MKFCSSCGHALDDRDVFCENCGSRQAIAVVNDETTPLFSAVPDLEPTMVIPPPEATQMFVPPTSVGDTRVVPPTQVVPSVPLDETTAEATRKKGISTPLLVLIVAAISTVVLTLIVLTVVLLTSSSGNDKNSNASLDTAITVTEDVLAGTFPSAENVDLNKVFISDPPSSDIFTYEDVVASVNDFLAAYGREPVRNVNHRYDDSLKIDIYSFDMWEDLASVEVAQQHGRVVYILGYGFPYEYTRSGVAAEDATLHAMTAPLPALAIATDPKKDFETNLTWHIQQVAKTSTTNAQSGTLIAEYDKGNWNYVVTANAASASVAAVHRDYNPDMLRSTTTSTATTTTTTTKATTTTTQPQLILPSASQKHDTKYYTVKSADNYVNMRYGPSLDYAVITTVPNDTRLSVTASNGGWLYTEYNGVCGWVHDLELKQDIPTNRLVEPSSYLPQTLYFFVSDHDGSNMRYGPSTDYAIVHTIPQGRSLDIIAQQGDWYFGYYGGYTGWVHASTITIAQDNAGAINTDEAEQLLRDYLDNGDDLGISYQDEVIRNGKTYYRFSVRGQLGDNPAAMLGFFLVAKDGSGEILDY